MPFQFGFDAGARRRVARRKCREIVSRRGVGSEPADLLPPPRRLVMTAGQTVGGKRDHGHQVVRPGRGGGAVGPAGGGLMVLLLEQHLRPDAVNAV